MNDLGENNNVQQAKERLNNKIFFRIFKRICDLFVALVLSAFLFLPLLVVGMIIKIESPGPALFKQDRVGKDGKIFTIYKFRTMRLDAPDSIAADQFFDSQNYITKTGRFLRRTSIDELPQIINILKGEMSLIGYRPVCLSEKKLNKLREENGVLSMRPGVTGLAQVRGRDNIPYKEKARIDTEYYMNCGFLLDLKIFLQTIKIVLTGEGVR